MFSSCHFLSPPVTHIKAEDDCTPHSMILVYIYKHSNNSNVLCIYMSTADPVMVAALYLVATKLQGTSFKTI